MSTLKDLGLKEITVEVPGSVSTSLYTIDGHLLAYVIRREPPLAKECTVNAVLRTQTGQCNESQFERAIQWREDLVEASKDHFALQGKSRVSTSGNYMTYQ